MKGGFSEERLDLLLDLGDGVIGGAKSGHGDALLVDDELSEVPLDGAKRKEGGNTSELQLRPMTSADT